MSKVNFFSNSLIVINGRESVSVLSPKDTREEYKTVFEVPQHTIGTNNLMIYVDGIFQMRGVDYLDNHSEHIEFFEPISPTSDFYAVLVTAESEQEPQEEPEIEWETF